MIDRIQVEREARAYMARGEWGKAIALYRELLESKGADPNIYNLIGDVYVKMDDLADAIPEYLSAIDLYEAEGLYENGIAVCKKIMRLMPDMGDVYFKLALFYAEIGLLNEAKDALVNYVERSKDKKMIEKDLPKYKKLMILLLSDERLKPTIESLYTKIGQREKELDILFGLTPEPEEPPPQEEELIEEPDKEPVISPAGKIPTESQLVGTPSKSEAQEKIITPPPSEMEPPAIPPRTVTETIETNHKPKPRVKEEKESRLVEILTEEEVQLLLHAIEEIKASGSAGTKKDHYELGLQYKNLGFYDAAIREFQLSSTMGPQRLKALKEVGFCFLEKEQPNIAVNAFRRAIEEGGKGSEDYIALMYGIGKAYELLGDKVKAIEAFEEVYLHDIHYKDVKEKLTSLKEA